MEPIQKLLLRLDPCMPWNMQVPPQAIFFDLDGTLIDSLSLTFDAFIGAIEQTGGPTLTPQQIMRHFGPGERAIFAEILGESQADATWLRYRDLLEQGLERVRFFDGIPKLLSHLRQAGIPLGIVTGRGRKTTGRLLQHLASQVPTETFEIILTHDDLSASKPSPEGILKACAHVGVEPRSAIYVGDFTVDILAARAAGTAAYAALWDAHVQEDRLRELRPDRMLRTPEDLVSAIQASPPARPAVY